MHPETPAHHPASSSTPTPGGGAAPYTAYSVSWNLTQRCNLECAHCYMSAFAGADTRGELTTDECRRVLDEIAQVNPNVRSEEHTSELQSHSDLVCRLLLEKKNNNIQNK